MKKLTAEDRQAGIDKGLSILRKATKSGSYVMALHRAAAKLEKVSELEAEVDALKSSCTSLRKDLKYVRARRNELEKQVAGDKPETLVEKRLSGLRYLTQAGGNVHAISIATEAIETNRILKKTLGEVRQVLGIPIGRDVIAGAKKVYEERGTLFRANTQLKTKVDKSKELLEKVKQGLDIPESVCMVEHAKLIRNDMIELRIENVRLEAAEKALSALEADNKEIVDHRLIAMQKQHEEDNEILRVLCKRTASMSNAITKENLELHEKVNAAGTVVFERVESQWAAAHKLRLALKANKGERLIEAAKRVMAELDAANLRADNIKKNHDKMCAKYTHASRDLLDIKEHNAKGKKQLRQSLDTVIHDLFNVIE